jgi:D-aminopeptidase
MGLLRRLLIATLVTLAVPLGMNAQTIPPNARDLGVTLTGTPGPNNAITDVAGVEVGHTTIIRGRRGPEEEEEEEEGSRHAG